jgi:hypothetical protein
MIRHELYVVRNANGRFLRAVDDHGVPAQLKTFIHKNDPNQIFMNLGRLARRPSPPGPLYRVQPQS